MGLRWTKIGLGMSSTLTTIVISDPKTYMYIYIYSRRISTCNICPMQTLWFWGRLKLVLLVSSALIFISNPKTSSFVHVH